MSEQTKPTDRLVAFTDAVVAIAITLLVLPLADLVADGASEHLSAPRLILDNIWQIYGFLLSFVVIARLWLAHHRLFEKVRSYSGPLIRWNMLWILFIVILPFPTKMMAGYAGERFTVGIYIGVVLACDVCIAAIEHILHRNPELADSPHAVSRADVTGSTVTCAILLLALLLAVFVPGVYYNYSLFLLVVPSTYKRLTARKRDKSSSEHSLPPETD
jgi:uncharacterized membrane protein